MEQIYVKKRLLILLTSKILKKDKWFACQNHLKEITKLACKDTKMHILWRTLSKFIKDDMKSAAIGNKTQK